MCEVLQVSRSGYYRFVPLREKLIEKQNRLEAISKPLSMY